MQKSNGDKSYLRSLQSEAMSLDKMPKKTVKKWKKKDRQKAKKEIKNAIRE